MRYAGPEGLKDRHPQLSALSDGGSSRRQRRAEHPEAGRSGSVERQCGRGTARRTKSAHKANFAKTAVAPETSLQGWRPSGRRIQIEKLPNAMRRSSSDTLSRVALGNCSSDSA